MLKTNPAFSAQQVTIIDKLIIKLGDTNQPSLCMLQEQLPLIFRITDIETTIVDDGSYDTTAKIYHTKAVLEVQWNSTYVDSRLSIGQLVSIRWKGTLTTNIGHIVISRLVPIVSAQSHINLFDTVPFEWCKDRSLVDRASKLIDLFSAHYRYVFNTIFWDSKRLYNLISSNRFMSTVENCERVMKYQYRSLFDIDKSVILLLLNSLTTGTDEHTSSEAKLINIESMKNSLHALIIERIIEEKMIHKDDLKTECWTSLLMSLDY